MKWLTPDERTKVEAWLDSGDTPGGRHGSLQRLAIAIALESGLRESEIIDLVHGQANIIGGRWEAVMRLKRRDRARIDANLGPRTARIFTSVFPNGSGEYDRVFKTGPTPNSFYKFCLRLGKRLGIQGLTPHRFRHTIGRDMAMAGCRPSEIQAALGHKSGATALIYYESTADEALAAVRRVRT